MLSELSCDNVKKRKERLSLHDYFCCQTVNDIALILSYFLTNLGEDAYVEGEAPLAERCLVIVYYSVTPEKIKERVKSSFESGAGTARIVIATTSLSMGVDFPCVTMLFTLIAQEIWSAICRRQGLQAVMASLRLTMS